MAGLHDRVERGQAIAASSGQIERVTEKVWSVQAQSGHGVYLVTFDGGQWKCVCPDFAAHSLQCKHIVGVQLSQRGVTPVGARQVEARRPRKTYRQNWPAYNQAQRAELGLFDCVLADLVADVEDPAPQKPTGRPRVAIRDLIYCAVQKVYQDVPLRIDHGLIDKALEEGRISAPISRNMPSILLRRADVTPILHDLIAESALALASLEDCFAVDSSGFRTTSFGDYCREKYGAPAHNVWLKAHIIVGTKTHIIPRVIVTQGHAADSPQFPGLVNGAVAAGFVLKEVYADKGYLAGENFNVVGKAGGTPFIMFKENSRGRAKHRRNHSPWWKQMWHRFQSNPSQFLNRYHQRENVEATFAAIKKKLGETLASRDPIAQVNELLCKILAYNITVLIHESFEHGIELPRSIALDSSAGLNPTTQTNPPNREISRPVASQPTWGGADN